LYWHDGRLWLDFDGDHDRSWQTDDNHDSWILLGVSDHCDFLSELYTGESLRNSTLAEAGFGFFHFAESALIH
jgi:hypothetical protein